MEEQKWIVVRNWDKFQHYRDRWVPWIKFYTEILHDPAYTRLPVGTRLTLCHIWLEYASTRAQLPLDSAWLSRQFSHRVTSIQLETLNHAGFIEFSSSPCLEHVKMGSRPTRAREEEEKKKNPYSGSSFLLGLSPTTRDASAPLRSQARSADAPTKKPKTTGWRWTKGSHGELWKRDPEGTDKPPSDVVQSWKEREERAEAGHDNGLPEEGIDLDGLRRIQALTAQAALDAAQEHTEEQQRREQQAIDELASEEAETRRAASKTYLEKLRLENTA